MARIRTIKPEFFISLTIGELSFEQRLTFIGLWTHADDEGRCIDSPELIKAALWPLDKRTTEDVAADLRALTEASLIVQYTVKRRRYLVISGWEEHQRINRPTASKFPPLEEGEITPPEPPTSKYDDSRSAHGGLHEDSSPERKGKEGNREGNRDKESSATVERDSPLYLVAEEVDSTESSDDDSFDGQEELTHDDSDDVVEQAVEPHREDVEKICLTLADRIEGNGSKRPTITKRWQNSARLMIDKDGRSLEQVLGAIEWCQADEFWHVNILSVPKLREKYDQLRLAATRQRGPATLASAGRPSTATVRVAEGYALSERLAAEEAGR